MVSDDNIDSQVISDFGDEWAEFGYSSNQSYSELVRQFQRYTELVDFKEFDSTNSIAADFGAGTGRWAQFILESFKNTWLVEPSSGAFQVLKSKFMDNKRAILDNATISKCSIPDASLDFAMSLGVLHHVSNTSQAFKDINLKLKKNGMFLGYLYYKVEDKPFFYRLIFSFANLLRQRVSMLPFKQKKRFCLVVATIIYWPLARLSKFLNLIKVSSANIPLHQYADLSFYMMKNDALDRFGTKLEKRYNQEEITKLLLDSGFSLQSIKFSTSEPFWTFVAKKF
jgi:ubiquinone/menaquinone biosynthesis C-methylase UbiE